MRVFRAITSGGAIPDSSDYKVVLEPGDAVIGSVSEDFAIESLQGDIFQLGNASWRIRRVERGSVRVEDAGGQPPTIPFWVGEAPGRTFELSESVSRLRSEVAERVESEGVAGTALSWLVEEVGVARSAAEQIVDYLAAAKPRGSCSTRKTLVVGDSSMRRQPQWSCMHLWQQAQPSVDWRCVNVSAPSSTLSSRPQLRRMQSSFHSVRHTASSRGCV